MNKKESSVQTFFWCMKLAWEMSRLSILLWTIVCTFVALLPAAALLWQKDILKKIADYIATGTGEFSQVLYSLIILGSIMILIGISVRLNQSFINAVVYDYYYVGLTERFMDLIQKVEVKTLNQKEIQDEYRYVRYRFSYNFV